VTHLPSGRRRPGIRRKLAIAAVLLGVAVVSGCAFSDPSSALKQVGAPAATQGMPSAPASSCSKPTGNRYLGVSVQHTNLIAPTDQAMGITANVTALYFSIGASIPMQTVANLCAQHIFPIIVLQDATKSPAQIASGADDKALQSYALALGTMQTPVGMVFDHEFNGPWSPWGYKNVAPAQFVAAWRHIVTLFRDNGATNVTWIWNPNVTTPYTASSPQPWYPGDAYVNWIGLDGYFYSTSDTYASVFTPTIDQIRAFTKRPQIIMETGANPTSGRPRAITSIFQGAKNTPGLLGLIYFDFDKTSVHNWYINEEPPALAAFKAGASSYLGAAGSS
jgi:mannan endo-1,4-beta-mannosidase